MAIDPVKKDWKWWDIGWNVHTVHSSNGRFVAASLYDGVVLQPKSAGDRGCWSAVRGPVHLLPAMICLRSAKKADLQKLFALDQICFPPGIAYSRCVSSVPVAQRVAEFSCCRRRGWNACRISPSLTRLPLRGVVVGLIVTIDVVEGFRRRGVGRLLMAMILSRNCVRPGAASIELEVAVDNLPRSLSMHSARILSCRADCSTTMLIISMLSSWKNS